MQKISPYLAVLVVAGLTCTVGFVYGRMTGRWGATHDIAPVASRLAGLPVQIGPWRLESSDKLPEKVAEVLECAGQVVRVYRNEGTQERVNLAVLLGPVGPIAVHTPEICYSSRAYTMVGSPEAVSVDNRPDRFWRTTFRSNNLEGGSLRVYHAWSDGTAWQDAKDPRMTFASRPYLYKLQMATYLRSTDLGESDPCRSFLAELLPVLQGCLVPANKN